MVDINPNTYIMVPMMNEKLKEIIENFKSRYGYSKSEGGCETCGYGGDEYLAFDVDAWDILNKEIDEFCEEMKDAEK